MCYVLVSGVVSLYLFLFIFAAPICNPKGITLLEGRLYDLTWLSVILVVLPYPNHPTHVLALPKVGVVIIVVVVLYFIYILLYFP